MGLTEASCTAHRIKSASSTPRLGVGRGQCQACATTMSTVHTTSQAKSPPSARILDAGAVLRITRLSVSLFRPSNLAPEVESHWKTKYSHASPFTSARNRPLWKMGSCAA